MRKKIQITAFIIASLIYFFILPYYSFSICKAISLKNVFVFYLINVIVFIFYYWKYNQRIYRLEFKRGALQEKRNVLTDDYLRESQSKISLQEKISRYSSLKKIIEEVNLNLSLESIAEHLAGEVFSLIAKNRGNCILYLVDRRTQKLALFKTKKEDKKMIIKAKEGDIFDIWVLRHTSPLLVEDLRKDFRFDAEKLELAESRTVLSLISAPFITDRKVLGILRLDSDKENLYTQDDLRFLLTICDFGAVALENAELFLNTQELAIHDSLTGAFTKGYFLDRLKEECKRSARQSRTFSLLMLDIDFFKKYNDQFGHTAGDMVLKGLVQSLNDFFEDKGILISRFGGEEFCVILSGSGKKEAFIIAEELRKEIEKSRISLRRQETSVTVSIGVANFPSDSMDEIELIIKADRAMYQAKQNGRNRVVSG